MSALKVVDTYNFEAQKIEELAENSRFCVEMRNLVR